MGGGATITKYNGDSNGKQMETEMKSGPYWDR